MSLFTVDPSKCKKDHICVAICPLGNIEQVDGVPTPGKNAGESCINCGHCVAACPTGALSHRAMRPEQCASIKPGLSLNADQADQFLRGRRSIRVYRTDPVDRAALARLIGTASTGPSGHNTQPAEWLVIHDTAEIQFQIVASKSSSGVTGSSCFAPPSGWCGSACGVTPLTSEIAIMGRNRMKSRKHVKKRPNVPR